MEERSPGLYNYIHTKVGSSLCYCLCGLTEIGSPMIRRVNNDVTLGLTNDRSSAIRSWSSTHVLFLDHWGTFCAGGHPNVHFSFLVAAGFEPTSL